MRELSAYRPEPVEAPEPMSEDEIRAGVRTLTLAGEVNPVFCGTAFKNKGVQPLLDAVLDYLPSPLDIDGIQGHSVKDEDEVIVRQPSDDEPFAGLGLREPFEEGGRVGAVVLSPFVKPGTVTASGGSTVSWSSASASPSRSS
mgnify:CR=1 FL=1